MDENAVRKLYGELLGAWNRREAGEYARLFSEDGYAIGFDGSSHEGIEKIESEFQNTPAAFHGRPELADKLTEELRAELNA